MFLYVLTIILAFVAGGFLLYGITVEEKQPTLTKFAAFLFALSLLILMVVRDMYV